MMSNAIVVAERRGPMKYHIHYGKLFPVSQDEKKDCLCYIKPPVYSQNKRLCSADGRQEVSVEIIETGAGSQHPAHRYIIKDPAGNLLAAGQPGYTGGSDIHPFSRGPRADHVAIKLPGASCMLQMQNSQNFILIMEDGKKAMELIHNGVSGGWNVSADDSLDAMLVMGIFLFSRYLDKENEFVVV